jgi:hypothetical protein
MVILNSTDITLAKREARRLYILGYNIKAIAKLPSMPRIEALYKWKNNSGWDRELELTKEKVIEKRAEQTSKEIIKMDEEFLRLARKAYKHIEFHLDRETVHPQELMLLTRSMDTVLKDERLIKNMATENKQVSSWDSIFDEGEKLNNNRLEEDGKNL